MQPRCEVFLQQISEVKTKNVCCPRPVSFGSLWKGCVVAPLARDGGSASRVLGERSADRGEGGWGSDCRQGRVGKTDIPTSAFPVPLRQPPSLGDQGVVL